MRAVAAVLAVALLVLVGPLAGPAFAGRAPAAGTLRLEVTGLGPRVVTADGPAVLSVDGTVTNIGVRPVRRIGVRVQRGVALSTEGEVRDALRGAAAADGAVPAFVELPDELAPGASAAVRLAVPLRDPAGLALARPGVYELLINVNGAPDGQDRSRLAALRMLLPVLSLPGDTPRPPPRAVPFTMLYPISDEPRRLATVPGETTLLRDDELAASFAPGGRLHGLLTALAERAPTGSRTRAGICLALDADLVSTAAVMRDGYEVLGPGGTRVPGTGAQAAGRWLDLLTTTARDGCVLALPFADADLVALTRSDQAGLAANAIADGRAVLANALGVPVLPDVTWPADGTLDERTLARAVAPQGRAVVLSGDAIARGRTAGVLPLAGADRPQLAVLTDPLLTVAAGGAGTERSDPAAAPPAMSAAGGAVPLSTQDLIGALAFRARDAGPDPLVLAPPHRWAAELTGAGELLTAVDQLVGAGLLAPAPLDATTGAGVPAGGGRRLDPLRAGAGEVPPEVVRVVATTRAALDDLRSAAVDQGSVGVGVRDVFDPLDRGLVRAVSAAWRARPDEAAQVAAAQDARVRELRATIRVLEPPSPYALGSADAPLLLTVTNGLPVSVRVRIEVDSSSGLRVAPIPEQVVPPLGRRQIQSSAELTRSGQFVVDAVVRTPGGQQLGPASRLRVRSTTYGTITVWLTGTAGVLLVVLAARRVFRRIRREHPVTSATSPPDPPDPPDPPNPSDPPPHPPQPPASPARTPDPDDRTAPLTDPDRTTRLPAIPRPPVAPRRPPPRAPSPRR